MFSTRTNRTLKFVITSSPKSIRSFLLALFLISGGSPCCKKEDKTFFEVTKNLNSLEFPLSMSAGEFRAILERHFPLNEIIKNGVNDAEKSVLSKLIKHSAESPHSITSESVATQSLMSYLPTVVSGDCPQDEREMFCKLVDQLMLAAAEFPNEDGISGALSLLFADWWVGWKAGIEGWATGQSAVEAWHKTELFQYLKLKRPPVSADLKERIRMVSEWKITQIGSRQKGKF